MDVAAFQAAFSTKNQETVDLNRLVAVQEMIQAVQASGDQAVIDYTNQFDGQAYTNPEDFKVSFERLKASWDNLDPTLKEALRIAKDRIERYEQAALYSDRPGKKFPMFTTL